MISWEVRDVSFHNPENPNGETFSIRIEWPTMKDREPFLTNILPRQWQCTPVPADQIETRLKDGPQKLVLPEPKPGEQPQKPFDDLYHALCDYSVGIKFKHSDVDAFRAPKDKEEDGAAPAAP